MKTRDKMAALQRVADSFADASGLPGGGYDPQHVDEDFCELVCDLADPLPDNEGFCTYALVRWQDACGGFYVSFRKVEKVWDEGRWGYGHCDDEAHFALRSAADVLAPDLVDVAIGWGPANGYVVARLLAAMGQLFAEEA